MLIHAHLKLLIAIAAATVLTESACLSQTTNSAARVNVDVATIDQLTNAQIAAANVHSRQELPTFIGISRYVNGISRGETVGTAGAESEKSLTKMQAYQRGAIDAKDAPLPEIYSETIEPFLGMALPLLLEDPEIKAALKPLTGIGNYVKDQVFEAGMRDGMHEVSLKYVNVVNDRAAEQAPAMIQKLIELHRTRPELREDIETRFGARLGLDFNKKPSENIIGSALEQSEIFKNVRDLIKANTDAAGRVKVDLGALKKSVTDNFASLNAAVKDQAKKLGEIQKAQIAQGKTLAGVLDALNNQSKDDNDAAQKEFKLQGAAAGFKLLGFLADAGGDPRLGKQIEGVGMSIVGFKRVMDKYETNLTSFSKTLGPAFSSGLSTTMLTTDLISIGLQLFSLFSSGGVPPEKLILDEIVSMRAQIDTLRTEMHDRFDQVSRQFYQLQGIILQQFDVVLEGLARVEIDTIIVQIGVSRLNEMLMTIQSGIGEIAKIQERDDINKLANRVIGVARRAPDYQPSQGEFLNAQSDFVFHGTSFANGPIANADIAEGHFDQESWAAGLHMASETNIRYFARLLARQFRNEDGQPKYSDIAQYQDVPNPIDWILGSTHTMELGYLYPSRLKGENSTLADPLIAQGDRLHNFQRTLSITSAGKIRTDIIEDIVATYQEALNKSVEAFNMDRDEFLRRANLIGMPLLDLPVPEQYDFDPFSSISEVPLNNEARIKEPRKPYWSAFEKGQKPDGPDLIASNFSQGPPLPPGIAPRLPILLRLAVQDRAVTMSVSFDRAAWVEDHLVGREFYNVKGDFKGRNVRLTDDLLLQTVAPQRRGWPTGPSLWDKIEADHLVEGKLRLRYVVNFTRTELPALNLRAYISAVTKGSYRHARDTFRCKLQVNPTQQGEERFAEVDSHIVARTVVGDSDQSAHINDFDWMARRLKPADLDIINIDEAFVAVMAKRETLSTLEGVNRRKLSQLRESFYGQYAAALESGARQDVGRRLDGAKALVETFAIMAYPQEIAGNDYLTSLIFGTEGLVDRSLLSWTLAKRRNEPIDAILADLKSRGRALSDFITGPYAKRANRVEESLASVERTRSQLLWFKKYITELNATPANDFPSPDDLLLRVREAAISK